MKAIKIKDKDYLFIEVPFDAYGFSNNLHFAQIDFLLNVNYKDSSLLVSDTIILKDCYDNKFQIISTTKDITEKQAENIVESKIIYSIKLTTYRDYMFLHSSSDYENEFLFDYMTAKESLKSLIQAHLLDVEKNYLILLKN